ncbi:hypothetical protein F2Q68_00039557 [Brassica cretica]|uniref:Uncharacterized protein n=1 Tax=Brassica cretica TaxID=69181 RepID=A0A8S9MB33_BRACR|nr:hypothetical protein F2Q68_00039557 [Brassica cretica]
MHKMELDRSVERVRLARPDGRSLCPNSKNLGQLDQMTDQDHLAGSSVKKLNSAGRRVKQLGRLVGFGQLLD